MPSRFTSQQIDFIKANIKGKSYAEISDMIYRQFSIQLTLKQIKSFMGNHNLNSGRTGRFEPGHVPFNKGTHTCAPGCEKTQFKPGHIPTNHRPVGSERINVDGYTEIKVAEPNKWRPKHIVIWEKANGPVPKGHALIFGDGNTQNISLNNLILITRAQLARLNQNKLIQTDIDLTRSGILIADIISKCSARKKESKPKRQKAG